LGWNEGILGLGPEISVDLRKEGIWDSEGQGHVSLGEYMCDKRGTVNGAGCKKDPFGTE
jgi:hypothetical protein